MSWLSSPSRGMMIILISFLAVYVLGWLFPDTWWATHSLAFLPPLLSLSFVSIALALGIWWRQLPVEQFARSVFSLPERWLGVLAVLTAAISAWLAGAFPITVDLVGDALRFEYFFKADAEFHPRFLEALLDWSLLYWQNGERTVLNGMHYLSHSYQITPREAFNLMGKACLFLMVFSSALFVIYLKQAAIKKLIILLLLLLPGYLWMFFGHFEIYAPAVVIFSLYCMVLWHFTEKPSGVRLFWLFLLTYLSIRIHTGHTLLLVVTLLAGQWFLLNHAFSRWLVTWRGIFSAVLLPITIAGFALYFLVFEDHVDPRQMAPLKEQLFLPLFSPPAPLDGYNLLSPAHLFDLLSHPLMLSSAALFVLLNGLLIFRDFIKAASVRIVLYATTLMLYLMFFSMMNPLLGLPLDIDLFSITAPGLIFLAAAIVVQLEDRQALRQLTVGVFALSLFSLLPVISNAKKEWAEEKMLSLAVRTYNTYWMGGMAPVLAVFPSYSQNEQQLDQFLTSFNQRIEGNIHPHLDVEYAELLKRSAVQYQEFGNQPKADVLWHKAHKHDANDPQITFNLMNSYFRQQQYQQAYALSQQLIMLDYPNRQQALRAAIHCALMIDSRVKAGQHLRAYTSGWPEDEFMMRVHQQYQQGVTTEELKNAFAR